MWFLLLVIVRMVELEHLFLNIYQAGTFSNGYQV